MTDPTPITAETVRGLAAAAQLLLAVEREEQVAAQLAAWLTAANDLNRKMSALEHWTLMPATVFTHPSIEGVNE